MIGDTLEQGFTKDPISLTDDAYVRAAAFVLSVRAGCSNRARFKFSIFLFQNIPWA